MLNKEQHRASRFDTGVNLVIAGAGTGKTRVLVEKVRNIIGSGYCPSHMILLLTFSKKAAAELKERIVAEVGPVGSDITSGTFHSYCFSFLRKYTLKTHDLRVLNEQDSEKIMEQIVKRYLRQCKGIPFAAVMYIVKNYQRVNTSIKIKIISSGLDGVFNSIREEFQKYKDDNNYIDFDDMIDIVISNLKQNSILREQVRKTYKYILVDEFQDTSEKNFNLLELILPEKEVNFFAVGDDWQSIYGFRNARVEYILNIQKFFSDVRIHKLKVNYRSKKEIVQISSGFIKYNKHRSRKNITAYKGKGGIVRFYIATDFFHEVAIINSILKKETSNSGIAILIRNNRQADIIKENLQKDYKVEIMTMHASKGLEFDTVIIAGIHDRIIPDSATDIEEERRLLYVALSRAQKELYIIGHINDDGSLSRFASELGMKL